MDRLIKVLRSCICLKILLGIGSGSLCLELKVLFEPLAEEFAENKILGDPDGLGLEDIVVKVGFKGLGPGHFLILSNYFAYLSHQVID